MLDLPGIRRQFPALQRTVAGRAPIFLDGPGGTQVPERVIDAIAHYLRTCNANSGGAFTTSRESDVILAAAHDAVADFLNAASPDEVVFGQNMTSLTFHISRSLARSWKPGTRVVVTQLDHDANVSPWVLAARDARAEVERVNLRPDGRLDRDHLSRALAQGPALLAITCASNALGTMPDIPAIVREAHQHGAIVYLDAVHYAPHDRIDVRAWDCDFLACSAYKFFGPHVGILYGKRQHLERLEAYKVRPAPSQPPGRWMTGTQNHEGIAGVAACVEYLASLGQGNTRRERLVDAMRAIREHETALVQQLLAGLAQRPQWQLFGPELGAADRAPTLAIVHRSIPSATVAEHLATHEIYAWHGHFYALELAEAFGRSESGFVRLGLVHYNTREEVERTLTALDGLGA